MVITEKERLAALRAVLKQRDSDDNHTALMEAAIKVGLAQDRKSVRHLIRLLNHANGNVRLQAIKALGNIGARRAIRHLKAVAGGQPDLGGDIGYMVPRAAERAIKKIRRS